MRLYADFNAQVDPGGSGRPGLVHLGRMGTLRDLCAARTRLRDGLALTLHMDSDVNEDIEVDAVARWISDPVATEGGYWVGEFDPKGFRDVPAIPSESVSSWFPCGTCGTNLAQEIQQTGLSSSTRCSCCDARVHGPIAPPGDGV
jgi:hypothetical protein